MARAPARRRSRAIAAALRSTWPDEAQSDGHAFDERHRHREVRIAGDRGQGAGAAAGEQIAVDRVDLPRGTSRRADERYDINTA